MTKEEKELEKKKNYENGMLVMGLVILKAINDGKTKKVLKKFLEETLQELETKINNY